jgi:hypothetical protein
MASKETEVCPVELQEIIDNQDTIEISLIRAKAKILTNYNPNGKTKPNKFLENQVVLMQGKLDILAKATFVMEGFTAEAITEGVTDEVRKVISSVSAAILPSHLRNQDANSSTAKNTSSSEIKDFISKNERASSNKPPRQATITSPSM